MLLAACYQAHLLTPQPDPLLPFCERTVSVTLWGNKSHDTQSTYCEAQDRLKACERAGSDSLVKDCQLDVDRNRQRTVCEQSNGIDQVRVRRNFGQVLLTVLTLGFWSPVQLQWACSKVSESPGVIGYSGSTRSGGEDP